MVLLVVAVAYVGSIGGPVLHQVVVNGLVNLTIVVGLYIFVGNSGVFTFGHVGFVAIGAYAGALFEMHKAEKQISLPNLPHFLLDMHLPTVPGTLAAGAIAAIFATIVSLPLMRLSGIGASLATFALLVVINVVASNWNALTGGSGGIIGVPATTTRESALGWGIAAIVLAYAFQRSAIGLRLRGSRDDYFAARSIGITIFLERRFAFILSAFVLGIGGALFGALFGSFAPDAFYLELTFLTIAMLVVGGQNSLAGAVVGTIFVTAAAELLRRVEQGVDLGLFRIPSRPGVQQLGIGLILLLVLIARPRGLTRGRELEWRSVARASSAIRSRRRRSSPSASSSVRSTAPPAPGEPR